MDKDLTIHEVLLRGNEAYKAGKFQDADRYYTAILKAEPNHPDANHNLGILAVESGNEEQGLSLLKSALDANPKIEQFWLSYLTALLKLGRVLDATIKLKKAKQIIKESVELKKIEIKLRNTQIRSELDFAPNEPNAIQLKKLENLYNSRQLEKALTETKTLLEVYKNSVTLLKICGTIFTKLRQFDSAINYLKKALEIQPELAEIHNSLGITFREMRNIKESIDCFENALKFEPHHTDALNNLGLSFLEIDQLDQAITIFTKAIELNPKQGAFYINLGNAFKQKGENQKALQYYKLALQDKTRHAVAFNNIGNIQLEISTAEMAIKSFKKAISAQPNYAEAYNSMAVALVEVGNIDKAIENFEKVIELKPDQTEAHRQLSYLIKYDNSNNHFKEMKSLEKNSNLDNGKKCNLFFGLAKAYEDVEDFKSSYKYYLLANALRKNLLNYNIAHDRALFRKIEQTAFEFSACTLDISFKENNPSPIFIVGLPRSGTTLIEQVITCHPKVWAGGELDFITHYGKELILGLNKITSKNISIFRNNYQKKLNLINNGHEYVTDKMPHNFRFIPLILAAFPDAKIVHVKRDPAATCWSNFKSYFPTVGLGYTYNLQDLKEYYSMYESLMKIWEKTYNNKIIHCDYDTFTSDQENQTKKLLEKLNFTWSKTCLFPHRNQRRIRTASQIQAKEKVYRGSSEAWKKFKPYLGNFFDHL